MRDRRDITYGHNAILGALTTVRPSPGEWTVVFAPDAAGVVAAVQQALTDACRACS